MDKLKNNKTACLLDDLAHEIGCRIITEDGLIRLQADSQELARLKQESQKESDYDGLNNALINIHDNHNLVNTGNWNKVFSLLESHKSYFSTQYKGAKNG